MERKAQGAIEYLLIIGAAILVVAVVVIALTGITSSATENTNEEQIQDTYSSLGCEQDINYLGGCTTVGGKDNCECCTKYPESKFCKNTE